MRWFSKRSLTTLFVVSILALFLAAACTGPEGDSGSSGTKGDTGSAGAKGDTGSAGAAGSAGGKGDTGSAGATGDTGSAGATGDTGPAGPTVPVTIIAIPKGETSSTQPAVIEMASRAPELEIYGSGFPVGDLIFAQAIFADGASAALERRSGDTTVSGAGTFHWTVRATVTATRSSGPALVVGPGPVTIRVTAAPSGVQATTVVVMVEAK